MLIMKEYKVMGFSWRILRDRYRMWYYLERDGHIIAEGNYDDMKQIGWYEEYQKINFSHKNLVTGFN